MFSSSRRNVLRTLAAAPVVAAVGAIPGIARAAAPEFSFKFGHNQPVTHPLHVRAQEAADRILAESKGRLEVKIFPNGQMGGDSDMLSQVRSGGIQMYAPSSLGISTLVPVTAINAIGFAFADYNQVWAAMDGKLGAYQRAAFEKAGLHGLERIWDIGFRQITTSGKPINTVADMAGLKIRVPVSPLPIAMFKALGAAPGSLQFAELYTALQTKVYDAQENPLSIIQIAKMYEVQKYCSMTNHMWDGWWIVLNGRAWKELPPDLQTLLSTAFNDAAVKERADIRALNDSTLNDLKGKGMVFNNAAPDSFRAALKKSGFYEEWHKKFGDEAWGLLEQVVGKLS
jgi:tripartite ATP-independent transporter DctP family solute receptor